jgi:hypothetical protein
MGIFVFLSFPVFYIIGLIATIRWIVSKSSKKDSAKERLLFLRKVTSDLDQKLLESPDKKASALLSEYKKELSELEKAEKVLVANMPVEKGKPAPIAIKAEGGIKEDEVVLAPGIKKTSTWESDLNKFWGNWYSENSINLLLYIGAFLIVASASIFVGFQWETIGGSFKASLLSLLTLAFFGFGAWFYLTPKIKNAGSTFIAIGALLIPFCGLAWYNFVFEPAGLGFGIVWLLTSIVAIITYSLLAYLIRHPFYTYIAGFGGLSMILSIVNVSDINQEYYILGGIFSAFVLLLSTKLFAKIDPETIKIYSTPLSISANVIMPISLVWGLFFALSGDRLFTIEVVLSAFLATIYYLTAYSFNRQINFLYASQVLFLISFFLFGRWLDFSNLHIFLFIQVISIIYLLVSYYLGETWKEESKSFSDAAHIFMPLFLLLAFFTQFSNSYSLVSTNWQESLFIIEIVISIFLATSFYVLAYLFKRSTVFAVLAQTLFPIGIFFAGKWLGFSSLSIYYLLEFVLLSYLILSYYIKENWKEESESLSVVPLAFAAGIFFIAFGNDFSAFHLTAFAVFPTVFGLLASYFQKNSTYLYYNFLFLAISVYLYFNNLLGLDHKPYILGSAYLGLTVIFYLISLSTKNTKDNFQAFVFATVAFAILGSLFTLQKPAYFFLANLVVASILLDYAFRFKDYNLIYLSNLFIFVALWSLLRFFGAKTEVYPLYFAGLSYLFYITSQMLPETLKNFYRLTSLVGIGANTLAFGIAGQGSDIGSYNQSYSNYSGSTASKSLYFEDMERNALLSSYASFFLYTLDAVNLRKASLGYFASAVGMLTYLWQMKYLGIDETQAYTLPLGVYFLVLAYLQKLYGKVENRTILDYIGLFFLLVPTLLQSFGTDGAKYALLLGAEGVIIFAIGISISYRTYIYAGIGTIVVAVLSQTYEFLFSLPRWLITAAAGIAFLGTAIYLLLHRKEEPGKQ